jgi:hypothetical protein
MIMSSLSVQHGATGVAFDLAGEHVSAFVRRLAAQREERAKRKVAAYLGNCSDERLRGLGLGNEDIRAIRAGTFNGVRG